MLSFYLAIIDDSPDNQNELELIYNTYKKDMYSAAFEVVQNQHDAEDAVHNAFLSIIYKLSVISSLDPGKKKAYLCRASRNCAINICVKQSREKQLDFSDIFDCSSDSCDDILNDICHLDDIQNIKKCILNLPDKYRDVLSLYYIDNMDSRRISKTLNISSASVRQRLSRGKKMLVEMLGAKEG